MGNRIDQERAVEAISSQMKWSPSAARGAVKQAMKGVEENPEKDIESAAYVGLSRYYCAWSDWMNRLLAKIFAESVS